MLGFKKLYNSHNGKDTQAIDGFKKSIVDQPVGQRVTIVFGNSKLVAYDNAQLTSDLIKLLDNYR